MRDETVAWSEDGGGAAETTALPQDDLDDEDDAPGGRQPWGIAWGSAVALVLMSVLVAILLLAIGLQIAKLHGAFAPGPPKPSERTYDNTLSWTTYATTQPGG